jgi:FMN-dependent NADH-azoreductase
MSEINLEQNSTTPKRLLVVNSSGRYQGSVTRAAAEQVEAELAAATPKLKVVRRDLGVGLPFIDEQWIAANFTDPTERQPAQKESLQLSDNLVKELQAADSIIIASPIYNFSIPAVLKAWIDLIARARLTFQYTESGPEGLLTGKKAYLVMASGGVPIASKADLATQYLIQVLGFVGISDIEVIDANQLELKLAS